VFQCALRWTAAPGCDRRPTRDKNVELSLSSRWRSWLKPQGSVRDTLTFARSVACRFSVRRARDFVRCVAINFENARWVVGMSLLRRAYLPMVPELEPFLVRSREEAVDPRTLGYALPQHTEHARPQPDNDLIRRGGAQLSPCRFARECAQRACRSCAHANRCLGVGVSLLSAALRVQYAARFRRRHVPSSKSPT